MEPSLITATMTTLSTALTTNISQILPVAGVLFALLFGIKLIPKIIKSFVR